MLSSDEFLKLIQGRDYEFAAHGYFSIPAENYVKSVKHLESRTARYQGALEKIVMDAKFATDRHLKMIAEQALAEDK